MPRLFVAVDLPEPARRRVAEIPERIGEVPGLRWVRPETLHLTLAFLGEVGADAIPGVTAALDALEVSAFELRIAGGGQFPPSGPARVVWMGVEGPLAGLASAVQDALVPLGFEREERPFEPHLTLGRARKLPVRIPAELLDFGDVAAWTVDAITLFESDLRPEGPIYAALHTSRLG